MRLSIRHDTTYDYADEVRGSIQYLRLTPQESARQRVLNWQLDLPHPVRAQREQRLPCCIRVIGKFAVEPQAAGLFNWDDLLDGTDLHR